MTDTLDGVEQAIKVQVVVFLVIEYKWTEAYELIESLTPLVAANVTRKAIDLLEDKMNPVIARTFRVRLERRSLGQE